ncbi:MAG: hypothetical protein WBQ50_17895 [Nocardioides sp.]
MRPDLVVISSSSLVVGVMCLVFGAALNPAEAGAGVSAAIGSAVIAGDRWLGMAVLWLCASVAMTCGMPAVLSLFRSRAHRLGTLAVTVFSIGTVGISGFAMLLVFTRALVANDAVRADRLTGVTSDPGLAVVLWSVAIGFYLGALLVAAALLVSRATPVWVPILLVAFVVLMPLEGLLGMAGQVARLMALAIAFTGIAISAVAQTDQAVHTATYSA